MRSGSAAAGATACSLGRDAVSLGSARRPRCAAASAVLPGRGGSNTSVHGPPVTWHLVALCVGATQDLETLLGDACRERLRSPHRPTGDRSRCRSPRQQPLYGQMRTAQSMAPRRRTSGRALRGRRHTGRRRSRSPPRRSADRRTSTAELPPERMGFRHVVRHRGGRCRNRARDRSPAAQYRPAAPRGRGWPMPIVSIWAASTKRVSTVIRVPSSVGAKVTGVNSGGVLPRAVFAASPDAKSRRRVARAAGAGEGCRPLRWPPSALELGGVLPRDHTASGAARTSATSVSVR